MRLRLLDPRTFPVARIAELVHALPAPGTPVDVADAPGGAEAVAWLTAHGRPARLVPAPAEPQETRLWEPTLPLSEWLVSGRGPGGEARAALDLGCGTGRDAVWLALHGWRVTAVDRLSDALDRARSLAELHGVTLDLLQLDVERDRLPLSSPRRKHFGEGSFATGDERGLGGENTEPSPLQEGRAGGEADLEGRETRGFDLVTAFRYLPDLATMASALVPGGTLLVETFTDGERKRTGKPKDPRLVLPAAGPPPLPEGLTLVDYRIAEHGGREFATLNAKRL